MGNIWFMNIARCIDLVEDLSRKNKHLIHIFLACIAEVLLIDNPGSQGEGGVART